MPGLSIHSMPIKEGQMGQAHGYLLEARKLLGACRKKQFIGPTRKKNVMSIHLGLCPQETHVVSGEQEIGKQQNESYCFGLTGLDMSS